MNALDREVAGMRCQEVLEHLSDFLDGDLTPDEVARVVGHLAGCDNCERFGAEIAAMVRAARALADEAPEGDVDALVDRLEGSPMR